MTEGSQGEPTRPGRRRSRRWTIAAAAVVLLGAGGLGWYVLIGPPGPLAWAKGRGWRSRPISETTLETTGFAKVISRGSWRNLPFRIGPAEEAAVRRCAELARSRRFLLEDVSQFEVDATRAELEAILSEHPDFFYAEALLALWHRMHGDAALAGEFQERAYRHAPVVLVQHFRSADGRPLAGALIQEVQIECNRVVGHSLDPSLKLLYMDLVTDDTGAIYLPAYDTVYRLYSISYPRGYSVEFPRLGWFESPRKVGILPPATVSPAPVDPPASP